MLTTEPGETAAQIFFVFSVAVTKGDARDDSCDDAENYSCHISLTRLLVSKARRSSVPGLSCPHVSYPPLSIAFKVGR